MNKDGKLTVKGWVWVHCIKCLKKGGGMEKRVGETKILKRAGMLGKGVGTLKRGGAVISLLTMDYVKETEVEHIVW